MLYQAGLPEAFGLWDEKAIDLRHLRALLGWDKAHRTLTIDQEQYAKSVLANFWMDDCQPCTTPMEERTNATLLKPNEVDQRYPYRNLIGVLIFFYQLGTRPDLSFSV